ncbi:MAG: DNA translocase FtsK, partial [Anaerolineae bacterium]
MNRQALESQANQLEATLARHKVAARVTGGQLSSRWIRYQVQPAPGTELARVEGLSAELALALDSRTCRVSRQNGTLTVQVARPDPQPVWLLPLQRRLKKLAPGTALLGLDDDGAPLLLRLPSPQV